MVTILFKFRTNQKLQIYLMTIFYLTTTIVYAKIDLLFFCEGTTKHIAKRKIEIGFCTPGLFNQGKNI